MDFVFKHGRYYILKILLSTNVQLPELLEVLLILLSAILLKSMNESLLTISVSYLFI